MSSIQTAIVVADGIQVIDVVLVLASTNDVLRQVEVFNWEVNQVSNLPRAEERLSLVGEPLEMNDEILRTLVNLHFLERILMSLA
jgi:hypothetical protein